MKPTGLKDFLQEKIPGRAGSAAPRVYLAAFGKHPGWNDHIDDLGFETQTLVTAKRFIYLEGISSQIDQGTWDRLDVANQHAVFDHWVLWHRGEEFLLGLMHNSRDGKGRSRYPMVLCLHVIGLPVARVVSELGPMLAAAMNDCIAVATATEVEAILDRARAALRERVAAPPSGGSVGRSSALPGHVGLGPDNQGLFRILYQVRNQFGEWAPGRINYSDEEALPRSAHLRAPQLFTTMAEGAPAWLDFFRSQIDRNAPVLLLWPRTAAWVDVIVGPPDGADFFALRANDKAIPSAQDVPYQIEAGFRAEAEALFGEFARGSAAEHNIFAANSSAGRRSKFLPQLRPARVAKAIGKIGRNFGAWLQSKPKKLVWIIIIVGIVLLVGIAALVFWSARPASARPAGTPPVISGHTATELNEETSVAWRNLCTAQYDWVAHLQGELEKPDRRAHWRSDSELRSMVIDRLDAANTTLDGLSPQRLANTSGSGQSLASNPPPSLTNPIVQKKILDASAVTSEVGQALLGWKVLTRLDDLKNTFTAQSWSQPAAELTALRNSVKLDSNLASAVDAILARQIELNSLTERVEAATKGWAALAGANDAFLAVWAGRADAEARAAKTLPELSEVLARWTHGLSEVRALIAPGSGLDRAQLTLAASITFDPNADAATQLDAWLVRARGYVALPEAEWPLTTVAGQSELTALREQAGQLRRLVPGDVAAGYEHRIDELAGRFDLFFKQPALRRDTAMLKERAARMEDTRRQVATDLAAEIGRRADPAAWLAAIRSLTLEGSAVVAREWVTRRDALLVGFDGTQAKRDIERFLAMQQQLGRLEAFLRAAAASQELEAEPRIEPGQSTELVAGITKVLRERREKALGELLSRVTWNEQVPKQTWAEFLLRPEAKAVISDYTGSYTEVTDFGARVFRLARKLDEGIDWLRLSAEEKEAPPAAADLTNLASAMELTRRLDILKQLSIETNRARLTAATGDADLAVGLAAWRALGRLSDWPATAAELLEEGKIDAALREKIEHRVTSSVQRPALLGEQATEMPKRWKIFISRAKAAEGMTAAFEQMRAFGVEVRSLAPRDRYNEWLFRLKKTKWRSLKSDDLAQQRKSFLDELNGFSDGNVASPAESWLTELGKVSMTAPAVDLAQIGPGGAGWKLQESVDSAVLSYRWEKAGQTASQLDFRLIESVVGKPFYLCTTEFPVKLLIDWSEQKNLWPDLIRQLDTMIQDMSDGKDHRRGPRAFVYNSKQKKLQIAPSWIVRSATEYYPDRRGPAQPDGRTPANYLTPSAVQLVAKSLNCRLPTDGEWRAANLIAKIRETKGGDATAQPNRRDTTWLHQWEHVSQLPAGKEKQWPSEDSFYESLRVAFELQKIAVNFDDGVLWFRGVDESDSGPFLNLVGNVAEFVTLESGPKVAVIGGSALSGPEVDVEKPYTAEAQVYSDVGFRLAFSSEKLTPGQIVARMVETAVYR